MSSAKRPYKETISFNSINDNNNNNDYIVNVEEPQEDQGNDMDVEHIQISKNDSPKNQQGENFIDSRRKRLNTDKDTYTFPSHPFPSILNNSSFQLSSSTSRNPLNFYSLRNTTSPPSRNTITTTNVTHHPLSGSNYVSPRDSFNNNTYNSSSNSTLKVSEINQEMKSLSPVDLLVSSPPISTSTSTPKTNQTRSASNSSLTLTTSDSVIWNNIGDFDPYSSRSTARAQINKNTSDSSTSSLAHSKPRTYEDVGSSGENTNNNSDNDNVNNFSSDNDSISNLSSNNNDVNDASSNNDNTDDFPSNDDDTNYYSSSYTYTTPNYQYIRTQLTKNESNGPFKPIYSQIYDNIGKVIDSESFNYLVQLYEFCDNSSTRLQSNVTSILGNLVLLLNNLLDGFDIPFIEHHKWNGSSFYGPVDVITLLDQLDDGLGLSSAEYVFYDRHYKCMRTSGSVLQCGCRKTFRSRNEDSFTSQVYAPSSSITNDLQNNELRHAVMSEDDEREAQRFLELLAEEDDVVEDNGTVQEESSTEQDSASSSEQESDSFTEISKESEDDDYYDYDDDDDSLIQGFASTSIQQPTDTFGNPINSARTTSTVTRRISRPVNNDGNETDNSLDDDLDNGNSSESAFEEIEHSDVESVATDSTFEDGWQSISRNN